MLLPTLSPTSSPTLNTPHAKPTSIPTSRPTNTTTLATFVNKAVLIRYPENPVIPRVIVSMPSMITSCYSPIIDLSGSDGSFSRTWKSVNVVVKEIVGVNSTSIYDLNKFLSSYKNTSTPIEIPYSYLQRPATYTFVVTLCNVFNRCGESINQMTVSNSSLPSVVISGQKNLQISRKDVFSLNSELIFGACFNNTSFDNQYKWSVFTRGTSQIAIVSVSKQSSKFLLPSYALNVNTIYEIKLTVLLQSNPYFAASDSVFVSVVASNIIPSILGGSEQIIRLYQFHYIDASNSYDEDIPNAVGLNAGLKFSWTCAQIQPKALENCPLLELDEDSLISPVLRIYANDGSLNSMASIVLRLEDSKSTRSSIYYIKLSVVRGDYPIVSILSNVNSIKFDTSRTLI